MPQTSHKQVSLLTKTLVSIVAFALVFALAAVKVHAFEEQQEQQGYEEEHDPYQEGQEEGFKDPYQEQEEFEISDAELADFAEVYSEVREIEQEYTEEVQQADGQEQMMQIQQEYQEKMTDKVRDSGISVERYNEIAERMHQDTELRQQIEEEINGDAQY